MDKKYLTEENYKRGVKKLKTAALIVLLVGLFIGLSLILLGIIKMKSGKNPLDNLENSGLSKEEIQLKIDSLNDEIASLNAQEDQEFFANGYTENYYKLGNEIQKKQKEINELENELESQSGPAKFSKDLFGKVMYAPLFVFGIIIIGDALFIAGIIFFIAHRREITAFTTQQVMPVAKEGIGEIAPTIGKAAGDIAKGIKEGLNSSNNDNSNNR